MAKPLLNPRQAEILAAIKESIATRGYPPTYRELSESLGISYPGSLAYSLNALARKGLLINNPMSHARGLRIPGLESAPKVSSSAHISPLQRSILLWCESYMGIHGYPPSCREIKVRFSLPSQEAVYDQLKALRDQGYLAKTPFRGRAIRILALPEEVTT